MHPVPRLRDSLQTRPLLPSPEQGWICRVRCVSLEKYSCYSPKSFIRKQSQSLSSLGGGIAVSQQQLLEGGPWDRSALWDRRLLSECLERLPVPGRGRQTHQGSWAWSRRAGTLGFAHTRFCVKRVDQFLNVGILRADPTSSSFDRAEATEHGASASSGCVLQSQTSHKHLPLRWEDRGGLSASLSPPPSPAL